MIISKCFNKIKSFCLYMGESQYRQFLTGAGGGGAHVLHFKLYFSEGVNL